MSVNGIGSTQMPMYVEQPQDAQAQPTGNYPMNSGASDTANSGSINYQSNNEQTRQAFQVATRDWPNDLDTSR